MAQGSQVPPFGDQGNEQQQLETNPQNGAKAINKLTDSPARPKIIRSVGNKPDSEPPKGLDASKPRHERTLSRDENDSRKSTDSPLRPVKVGLRGITDSPLHRQSGINSTDSPKRVPRHDRSLEPSPLHPHHQAKLGNKNSAVSSSSWERKSASEAPLTPGRSRLRSVARGDETPDDSPTVPKFGDWDDNDPASADGFTHIFERVREEKHSGGGGKVPVITNENSFPNAPKRYGNGTPKGCGCFPWGGK